MPDAQNNAQLRRNSSEVHSEDLRRVLSDPAISDAFERMESTLVNALATQQHDGTAAFQESQDEAVRTLRTIRRLRMGMFATTQMQDLSDAGFKPLPTEENDDGA